MNVGMRIQSSFSRPSQSLVQARASQAVLFGGRHMEPNPKHAYTAPEMVRLLRQHGFQETSQGKGDHRQMKDHNGHTVVVPFHSSKTLGTSLQHDLFVKAGFLSPKH